MRLPTVFRPSPQRVLTTIQRCVALCAATYIYNVVKAGTSCTTVDTRFGSIFNAQESTFYIYLTAIIDCKFERPPQGELLSIAELTCLSGSFAPLSSWQQIFGLASDTITNTILLSFKIPLGPKLYHCHRHDEKKVRRICQEVSSLHWLTEELGYAGGLLAISNLTHAMAIDHDHDQTGRRGEPPT